jgi:hypothetical protein
MRTGSRVLVTCSFLLLALGCRNESTAPEQPTPPEGVMPDFSLLDANPDSPSHDQAVSPRQHLSSVSAYYFGTAT